MSTQSSVLQRRSALSVEQQRRLAQRVQQARSQETTQIPQRSTSSPVPLSFAQQRLWFLDQLAPGNSFYNIPAALPLHFPVDKRALEQTIQIIVQRHETLRTTFVQSKEGPVQRIAEEIVVPLRWVDLMALPQAERSKEFQRLANEEARTPFDLTMGPLLRTTLVQLGPNEQIFLLTLHHIIADGWSLGLFFRELMLLYEGLAHGRHVNLPQLAIQYADFALWQRQHLRGQELDRHLSYWRKQLQNLPQLKLITDHPRPPFATFAGAFFNVAIPTQTTRQAEMVASQHGCTLFQLLLAVFQVVLNRYTNQDEIVVGAPIANRTRAEIEGLIGFFVNTLVLRTDLAGDPTFREALTRVRNVTLDAYAHQELPFETLVQELQPERDLSRNPLCQVTFQIQNTPTATGDLPSGVDEFVQVERGTALFDIAFSLWETQAGLIGGFEYSTDLFEEQTICNLASSFICLLEAVLADPSLPITHYPLLSPAMRQEVLFAWNKTSRSYPTEIRLHHLVEQQVDRTPAALAVASYDQQLTYAELDQRANQLAHYLANMGVGAGQIVGLCMVRGSDMVVALLGILKAGAAFLPLDPLLPQARLAGMVDEAQPSLILTHRQHVDLLSELCSNVASLDQAAPEIALLSTKRLVVQVGAESLAYLLYTSGSTGKPKAVLIHHDAVCNHMYWIKEAVPLTSDDRLLQRTPFYFDASIWEFFAPLQSGATLVIPPPAEAADIQALIDEIRHQHITILQLVPSLLRVLLEDPTFERCTSLRRLCCGGEPLTGELRDRFFARVSSELWNFYGPTETTIQSIVWQCSRDERHPQVAIGRPIDNTRVYILDARGEPLPPGVIGEIWIAGKAVGVGYLHAPELTQQRFGRDPFVVDGSALFRTGDLGWRRNDGVIFCAGRLDDQVKIRGNRIELGEVEAALRAHPLVDQAIVVTHPDAAGEPSLTAYVTIGADDPQPFGDLTEEHVAGWQRLYEEVYADATVASDPTFNITGWTSTYTGEAIPAEEMRHWLDHTVSRILALHPQRVLEIGCGPGLVLFRVAPRCRRYLGFDFSRMAIQTLRDTLGRTGISLPQVTLDQRTADDLSGLLPQSIDTVILNSVVQYFPSLTYLSDLVGRLTTLLVKGGTIFLGDIRTLPLHRAFHTSVGLYRAQVESPVEALREWVQRALEQDKELVIDPAFFWTLPQKYPAISSVSVRVKRGTDNNELVNYRYDVTLHVHASQIAPVALKWRDWRREGFDLDTLCAHLEDDSPDLLALRGIPNRRVARAVRAAALLRESVAQTTIGSLLSQLEQADQIGVEVESLIQAGEDAGYEVDLLWSGFDEYGELVAIYRKRNGALTAESVAASVSHYFGAVDSAGRRLATNPMLSVLGPRLIPLLRQHLQELLPIYMIPRRIEPLAAIPLKPNGKLDRAALPVPVEERIVLSNDFVAPQSALQQVIAQSWCDVLRIKQVGIRDNFFTDLGGHSLLATQVVTRLRAALQIEFSLRLLFEYPSIEALAIALQSHPDFGPTLEQVAQMVLALEDMAEEELNTLLAEV